MSGAEGLSFAMNKPLPYPYDAAKVSILIPRSSDGDYEVAATLSQMALPEESAENWPDIVDAVRANYGDDAEVWAREDVPDVLNGEEVTGEDIAHLERVKMSPEREAMFGPMVRNPQPVGIGEGVRKLPKMDPEFAANLKRVARKVCRRVV